MRRIIFALLLAISACMTAGQHPKLGYTPIPIGLGVLQTATTSGSTPSVAFASSADAIDITFGASATTTTITGLSLDADHCYDIQTRAVAPGAAINVSLNGTDSTGLVEGYFFTGAGAIITKAQNTLLLSDQDATAVYAVASLCASGPGTAKIWQSQMIREATLFEQYIGRSTVTVDVTSISINGMPSGSTLFIRRRPGHSR